MGVRRRNASPAANGETTNRVLVAGEVVMAAAEAVVEEIVGEGQHNGIYSSSLAELIYLGCIQEQNFQSHIW